LFSLAQRVAADFFHFQRTLRAPLVRQRLWTLLIAGGLLLEPALSNGRGKLPEPGRFTLGYVRILEAAALGGGWTRASLPSMA